MLVAEGWSKKPLGRRYDDSLVEDKVLYIHSILLVVASSSQRSLLACYGVLLVVVVGVWC